MSGELKEKFCDFKHMMCYDSFVIVILLLRFYRFFQRWTSYFAAFARVLSMIVHIGGARVLQAFRCMFFLSVKAFKRSPCQCNFKSSSSSSSYVLHRYTHWILSLVFWVRFSVYESLNLHILNFKFGIILGCGILFLFFFLWK